jgi:PPOX class probable F420-dependent enzyme
MIEVPEEFRDLLDAQFATFATVAPDGRPHLTEVWFLAEEGQVKISINKTRKKVANLRANPKCALFILDLTNPGRYLEIRGDATIAEDDDYAFASRVGKKYNANMRDFDGDHPGRVEVTIMPVRVNGIKVF